MSHVSLGVQGKTIASAKGCFVANYYIKGKTRKSKTISLETTDPLIAYETVDLWAQDRAKEFNVPYNSLSFEELSERLANAIAGKLTKTYTSIPKRPVAKNHLNNLKFFRQEVNFAFKNYPLEKIKEVLKDALELVDELEAERIQIEKNSGKAKSTIAKAMYTTFVDTGVDTSVYCTDEDIIKEFKQLRLEAKKL